MKRTFLLFAAILLMGFSIFLIVKSSQKSPVTISKLEFPEQIQISSSETYQIPPYEMTVNQPSIVIMGKVSHVNVIIHPVRALSTPEYPPLTDTFQVFVESKLEILNAQIAPDGLIHSALRTDQDTKFTWNIRTDKSTPMEGTLWIYLALQPRLANSVTEEQPLFAIPINLEVKTILGLPADLAVVIGIFGNLLAIALLILALRPFFPKKQTKNPK